MSAEIENGSLSQFLFPLLRERFPSRGPTIHETLEPFARFDPVWPDFGRLEVHGHGDEITIEFGAFTHVHVGDYSAELSPSEKAQLSPSKS